MTILLVSPDQKHRNDIYNYISNVQNEEPYLFQYTHPVKALDNLDEIQPTIIIWDIESFPRHWKLIFSISGIRYTAQVFLVSSYSIDKVEIKKAEELGVAGLIQSGFQGAEIQQCLKSLFEEKKSIRVENEYIPKDQKNFYCLLSDPNSLAISCLQISALETQAIRVQTSDGNLKQELVYPSSNLKLGEYTIELDLLLKEIDKKFYFYPQSQQVKYVELCNKLSTNASQ